jgi:hypothetical protein
MEREVIPGGRISLKGGVSGYVPNANAVRDALARGGC